MSLNMTKCYNVEKVRRLYGELFPTIDFIFDGKITESQLKRNGKRLIVGKLLIGDRKISMSLKTMESTFEDMTTKLTQIFSLNSDVNKREKITFIEIQKNEFEVNVYEIDRIRETLMSAHETAIKKYRLMV